MLKNIFFYFFGGFGAKEHKNYWSTTIFFLNYMKMIMQKRFLKIKEEEYLL